MNLEADDYNSEYFFNREYDWEEYQETLSEYELTPQEYNAFILEQAISDIKEIGKLSSALSIVCGNAVKSIERVCKVFDEYMNGEE